MPPQIAKVPGGWVGPALVTGFSTQRAPGTMPCVEAQLRSHSAFLPDYMTTGKSDVGTLQQQYPFIVGWQHSRSLASARNADVFTAQGTGG